MPKEGKNGTHTLLQEIFFELSEAQSVDLDQLLLKDWRSWVSNRSFSTLGKYDWKAHHGWDIENEGKRAERYAWVVDRENWMSLKLSLGSSFASLPILETGSRWGMSMRAIKRPYARRMALVRTSASFWMADCVFNAEMKKLSFSVISRDALLRVRLQAAPFCCWQISSDTARQ